MTDVDITGTPGAILRTPPDAISALDLLGVTLATTLTDWRVEIRIGGDTITARPSALDPDPDEDEAA